MSLEPSLSPKLGVARTPSGEPLSPGPETWEFRFRKEVSQLVHDLLRKHYEIDPTEARKIAQQRGMTVEQLMAATITHLVMKKVDEEYI